MPSADSQFKEAPRGTTAIIKSRRQPKFEAWTETRPKLRSVSECSEHSAVMNLALKIFFGHNKRAQLPAGSIERITLARTNGSAPHSTWEATLS